MIKHKKAISVFSLFFSFFLLACSPLNEFYVNNFSNENLRVELSLKRPSSEIKIYLFPKLLLAPSSGDYKKCEESNVKYISENQIISFEIPPHKTVFLGTSSLANEFFTKLVIASRNKKIVVTSENYHDYFKTRDSFYSNIANTLDFKEEESNR